MEGLSRIYQDNVARFDGLLGVGRSCDMVARDFRIGGRRARIWVVDGYGRDAILERGLLAGHPGGGAEDHLQNAGLH